MLEVKQLFEEVVLSIKKGNLEHAANNLKTLINNRPELNEDWLSICKLALMAGEVCLARKSLQLFKKRPTSSLSIELAYLVALVDVGDFEEAVKKAELLFKENVNSPQISHFLSTVYLQIGDRDSAAKYAQQTLLSWPLAGEAWLILINSLDISLDSEIFKKMLSCENQIIQSSNTRAKSCYLAALSKVYEDHKIFDLAFGYAQKSNEIVGKENDFNLALDWGRVKNIIQSAVVKPPENELEIHCNSHNPIFIVGLPRSGTTLLEQILCSHSKVIDGGEINGMERAARILTQGKPIGESISHFETSSDQLNEIKRVYLTYVHEKFGSNGIVVDKSLNNSRYVWLIRRVFPDSPIIFLHRNPLDSAWSCFKTHFSQGLHWSTKLEDIAAYFESEFELRKHWNNILRGFILNVNYEDIINNKETEIRKIMDFCHLEFESSMLEFYKSSRPVFTASTVQVRKNINLASTISTELEYLMTRFVDNFKAV